LAWTTTHELDPYRPLSTPDKTLVVDAISLDWKWLFIYPDQRVAVVNELALPVGTPVEFHVTSDAVMNSFFIPGLGGQIYSMAGMQTKISLLASEPGEYDGMSSNYSGAGFSGMKFKAHALAPADFAAWLARVRASSTPLDTRSYAALAAPSENNPVSYYSPADPAIYDGLIAKYLGLKPEAITTRQDRMPMPPTMPGMDHGPMDHMNMDHMNMPGMGAKSDGEDSKVESRQ
jgi:cytochrome o ubiquinol oxidase subunit 2